MAPVGQTFSHFMQPMQPFEQATRVCAPFWVLLQRTMVGSIARRSAMMWFGQVRVQMPQPVHTLGMTLATPFTTWMASDGQAFSQSP